MSEAILNMRSFRRTVAGFLLGTVSVFGLPESSSFVAAQNSPKVEALSNRADSEIFVSRFETIFITGNEQCQTDVQSALGLLQSRTPEYFRLVADNITIVECAQSGSGIYADEIQPRLVVGDAVRLAGQTWLAGAILHDAVHSKRYHEYLAQHPGEAVPSDTWKGQAAEANCLAMQADALGKMGAAQEEVDYVNQIIHTEYWNIPVTERYW